MKKLLSIGVAQACAAAVLAFSAAGAAQAKFPDHPIRVVIPYAPGGGTDILFRVLAPIAGKELGQSIIIDNKPGASTMIGTADVARAAHDGYTLLAVDSAILINPGLYRTKLPYDTLKSLQGVTMMGTAPTILVTNPKLPVKNLKELIALAKAKPGQLNFGSGGIGTAVELAGELLKIKAHIDIVSVPYKGTGPALTAVLGNQVGMMFGGISSARPYVTSGKLNAIAVTGEKRNPAMPDVPTFAEQGLDIQANSYWGIYAPVGVPKSALDTLNHAFVNALKDPTVIKRLRDLGYTPIGNSPEQHTKQLHSMVKLWEGVVQKANIKVQ